MTQTPAGADLSHIETWLFDLDNTLYEAESGFMGLIEDRMTEFVAQVTGLVGDEAKALRSRYYREHGTTLAGMMVHHGIQPEDYLAHVHDVPLDLLLPSDPLKAALERLPGRRLVFTNASEGHAHRLLEHLGLTSYFEGVFAIEQSGHKPKPHPDTFQKVVEDFGIDPKTTAFFEDSEKNLAPAAAIGMTTILVGGHAAASTADFVDHRTADLTAFLDAATLRETP